MSLRKSKTKRTQRRKYEEFLARMGVSPTKKASFVKLNSKKVQYVRPGADDCKRIGSIEDTHSGALTKSGIMKDFHKLSQADREIVDRVGNCIAPLHKGHYTYVSDGMDPASLGRKNEIL